MTSPFLGEFMGTLTLILLGDGVVACVLLNKSKGQNGGWMVITTAWGFAVTFGVYVAVAFGSKEAFLNPAVALWWGIGSGDWSKVLVDVPAEILGAFVGGVLVWLEYLAHWKETEDKGAKLGVFCTIPAIRNPGANLLSEVIGTVALIVGIGVLGATPNGPFAGGLAPYIVGVLIWAIGLSLGGPTGYAINPARDLGPRLAHAVLPIAGKGGSDWGYAWVPIAGPLIGAVLGTLILKAI
jgi:glycerol uptake facilitator protein